MSDIVHIYTPVLPESVRDGTIAKWLKAPGEVVLLGEGLLELETDKVILEIPAPVSGTLMEILAPKGTVVKEGEPLGTVSSTSPAPLSATPIRPVAPEASPVAALAHPYNDSSPSERQRAYELGELAKNESSAEPTQESEKLPSFERMPMSRMRRTIADRLLSVTQNTAMLTTFNDVNMSSVMALRAKHQAKFESEHGIKLGFMSFFVKAVVEALESFPMLNASIDGDDIIMHRTVNMGVAISTDRGLVVPVIPQVEEKSFQEIEHAITNLALKARSNNLAMKDFEGGTFTITNGGTFGSLLSTPLINPPQSAILGMHRIEDRAVVIGGEIVSAPMMYLAVSYDHCLIDGKEAVGFLKEVKNIIESPEWLLFS